MQPGPQEFLTATDAAGLLLVKEVLTRFGRVRVRVQGLSMVPAIRPGDILTIERASAASFSRGRVVLFDRDERLFAHRVVAQGPRLTTRGDAHWRPDPPVDPIDILGLVTAVTRDGRLRPVPRRSTLLRSAAWSVMMRVRHTVARLAGAARSQRTRKAATAQ